MFAFFLCLWGDTNITITSTTHPKIKFRLLWVNRCQQYITKVQMAPKLVQPGGEKSYSLVLEYMNIFYF